MISKLDLEESLLSSKIETAKPCPFCGAKKLAVQVDDMHCKCSVCCDDCGAEGPAKHTEIIDEYQNAFEAWNYRPESEGVFK